MSIVGEGKVWKQSSYLVVKSHLYRDTWFINHSAFHLIVVQPCLFLSFLVISISVVPRCSNDILIFKFSKNSREKKLLNLKDEKIQELEEQVNFSITFASIVYKPLQFRKIIVSY